MNAIFTLGCTPLGVFADKYRTFLKKKNRKASFCYLPHPASKVRPADIYLIETVTTFVAVKQQLPDNAIAVLSDSPLLLIEVPSAMPLDFDATELWRLKLSPSIDLAAFDRAARKAMASPTKGRFASHPLDRVDKLGLVVNKTTEDGMLTPFNAIMFQFNVNQRSDAKKALYEYLFGKIDGTRFKARLAEIGGPNWSDVALASTTEFVNVSKKKLKPLKEAIVKHRQGGTIKKVCSTNKLAEFEVRYLSRLVAPYVQVTKKAKTAGKETMADGVAAQP